MARLTATAVKAASAAGRYGDGDGLFLLVGRGGGTGGGPLISAWADLGDTRGYGLRAGFRF